MSKEIYGVSDDEKVTPLVVRDAIVNCFYHAHCEAAEIGAKGDVNRSYCKTIVEKAFKDTGGDFEHPTKESIEKVLEALAEFAKGFRNPKLIEKHYAEIMKLVGRME